MRPAQVYRDLATLRELFEDDLMLSRCAISAEGFDGEEVFWAEPSAVAYSVLGATLLVTGGDEKRANAVFEAIRQANQIHSLGALAMRGPVEVRKAIGYTMLCIAVSHTRWDPDLATVA